MFWDGVQLLTILLLLMIVSCVMCERSCNRVSWMNIIVSHVSRLVVIVRYSPVHCFHWSRGIVELAANRWLWTSQHYVVWIMLNHRLVPLLLMITWNGRRLYCTDLTSDTMSPVHHFVKDFLFSWVSIGLIFLTYWYTAISRIVPHAKEVCSSIVSIIGFRLVGRALVLSCHYTRRSLFWNHGMYAFHIEPWRLGWLPWHRIVGVGFSG